MGTWERRLHAIAVTAVDQLSDRLVDAEDVLGGSVAKLAQSWRKLDDDRKQEVAGLVGAAATSLIAALAAIRHADTPTKRRKAVRKLGKKAVKTIASVTGGDAEKVEKTAKKTAKKGKKKLKKKT